MTIISIEEARHHLRVEPDYPAEQVLPYLEGAESLAQRYLNRRVYADQAELDAARQSMVAALQTAAEARDDALEAARQVADCVAREMLTRQARSIYADAVAEQRRVARGMVIEPHVRNGILLILGHLDENRETVARGISVAELPMGAIYFLRPSRVDWGI
ncbi:head-tail connector protein [Delftia tsuruhatensis]|uniref:Phage gp6-like head-tail connector protein n=1 Tax=Delftia tsuruhatensis TaxID=180282 RepID=A0ABM6E5L8_9BURK|nr:head-tail connector protein [Delftia tsuruhatensis]AOV02758.1 hypothetical protein BI380_16140 [Delftia tsuruhatensis]